MAEKTRLRHAYRIIKYAKYVSAYSNLRTSNEANDDAEAAAQFS